MEKTLILKKRLKMLTTTTGQYQ